MNNTESELEIFLIKEIKEHKDIVKTLTNNIDSISFKLMDFESKSKAARDILIMKESIFKHNGAILAFEKTLNVLRIFIQR